MNDTIPPPGRYQSLPLFAVAVVFVLLMPLYWQITEHRSVQPPDGYENADLYGYVFPVYRHSFARLASGDIPLWNPYQLSGVPLHSDPGVGLWQPLNAVFLALPTNQAMAWHALASLTMMALGTALCLRALGAGYLAATFGGIVFACCGATAGVMSRPAAAGVLAWAPWAFWAATECMHRPSWIWVTTLGVLSALMVAAGSLGVAGVMLVSLTAYYMYGLMFSTSIDPLPLSKRMVLGLYAGAVAAGVSAIVWVPAMWHAPLLTDASETIWRTRAAMGIPAQLLDLVTQLLAGSPAPLPRMGYAGVVPLLFIVPALLHRDARRPAIFFLLLMLAAGYFSVVGDGIMTLRLPWHAWAYPAAFALALLAGLGLDRLLRPHDRFNLAAVSVPAILVIVVAGVVLAFSAGLVRGYTLAAVAAVIFVVIFRRRWAAVLAGMAVIALLFMDLTLANGNHFRHPWTDAPAVYGTYDEQLSTAGAEALGGRIAISAAPLDFSLPANTGMLRSRRMAGGAFLGLTHAQADWWRALSGPDAVSDAAAGPMLLPNMPRPALLDFMAVRAILTTNDGPTPRPGTNGRTSGLRQIRPASGLWRNDNAMPRAYWVPAVRTVDGVQEAAEALSEEGFARDTYCVVDRFTPGLVKLGGEILALVPGPESTVAHSRADGACSIEDVSPEELVVDVNVPAAGMIVVADSFDSGWRAYVDDEPRVIVRANGIYRGVHVDAGKHRVRMVYEPRPFYLGAGLSVTTIVVLLVAGVVGGLRTSWRRRPRRVRS